MNSDVQQPLITLSDLHAKFGWEEYIVLAITLVISGLIGVFWAWRSRKERSKLMNAYIKFNLSRFVIFFSYLDIHPLARNVNHFNSGMLKRLEMQLQNIYLPPGR